MERELESLFKGVAYDLLDVHVRTEQPDQQPGLVFPVDRDGDFRVSEQEAKQLFFVQTALWPSVALLGRDADLGGTWNRQAERPC